MPSGPQIANRYKRRACRFRPEDGEEAFVHFDLADGVHWTLSLVEISDGGLAFGLNDGRPRLKVGARIDRVTVEAGGFELAGSARVTHVTSELGVSTICGAEFAPSTEADKKTLALVLNTILKRSPRLG